MYKKHILKIGNSKKCKAMTSLVLGLLMIGSMASVVSASAQDTFYDYNSSEYGFATDTRPKEDYTSSYIWHKGNDNAYVEVRSKGINLSVGGRFYVSAGSSAYLPNTVKENGHDSCYRYITPASGRFSQMYGQWSPDSV